MGLNLTSRIILASAGLALLISSLLVYILTPELPVVSVDTPTVTVPFRDNFIHLDSSSNERDPKTAIYVALGNLDRFFEFKSFTLPKKPSKVVFEERFLGCFLGMSIADAYSLAFLHSRPSPDGVKDDQFPQNLTTDIFSPGDFSIITSHSLIFAASLIQKRLLSGANLKAKLKLWHESGFMSSNLKAFGHGPVIRKFIDDGFLLDLENPADEAMAIARLAPVILFYSLRNLKTCMDASAASVLLTHAHVNCQNSARILTVILWSILHNPKSFKSPTSVFILTFPEDLEIPDSIKFLFDSFGDEFLEDPTHLSPNTCEGALYFSLKAFKESKSYFEGLELLLKDKQVKDSAVCALYGMIAGAFYGKGYLPFHLVNQIYAGAYLYNLGNMFFDLAFDPLSTLDNYSNMKQKYKKHQLKNVRECPETLLESYRYSTS
jgi:ADP-ribosylglycohydrolase